MNKVSLTELVMNNLHFLGFEEEFYSNQNVIKYFLDNNISSIFGKNTFIVDSFDESKSELHIIKFKNNGQAIIRIIWDNKHFDFIKSDGNLVFLNRQTGLNLFKISFIDNKFQNILVSIDEPTITSEIQKYATFSKEFEYTKTIKCFDEEIKYPIIKIKPMLSKNRDIDFFELSHILDDKNMSLIDKIKYKFNSKQTISVTTGYGVTDYTECLNEIFTIMKNECNKVELVKKRKL